MFELFKLIWDVVVLRDAARRGKLNWRVGAFGVGFAVLEYAIVLPVGILYANHPQYKALFVCAAGLAVANLIAFLVFGFRWWARQQTAR